MVINTGMIVGPNSDPEPRLHVLSVRPNILENSERMLQIYYKLPFPHLGF